MAKSENVGAIAELWRFPVKSMGGEQLEKAEVTARGVLGDRAYALIDTDTGRVVSAKSVRYFPDLLKCKATFVQPPTTGNEPPPVQISLPDGSLVISDSADADKMLSAYFGRNVELAKAAPNDYTIDMYHPDVDGAGPEGKRDTVVAQKLGAALFAELGVESPVPVGSFFDVFPMSVLTTSTLSKLGELEPESRFDVRRFRMNVIVDTEQPGFVENDWVGHEIGLGDGVQLSVDAFDSRCVMTTLAQDDLPNDTGVLRSLVRHNRVQVGDLGKSPCAGVYASVASPGTVQRGDPVSRI